MVKNSTSKKRHGIGRGIKKHKLRVGNRSNSTDGSVRKTTALLGRIAQLCWAYQTRTCSSLLLLPFQASDNGKDISWGSKWRLVGHYVVLVIAALITAFRLVVTVRKAVFEELDVTLYLYACYVLISMTIVSSAMGSTRMGREMVQLLNSLMSSGVPHCYCGWTTEEPQAVG